MKTIYKLGLALLLGVLSVVFLFGCAGDEKTITVTPVDLYPSEAETVQQQIAPAKLRLFIDISNMPDVWNEINEGFQAEYPMIECEFEPIPEQNKYDTVLKTKVATGDVPDIFVLWPGERTERYVDIGACMDLTDKPYMQKIEDRAKEDSAYKGKVWSLPLCGLYQGVFYNKEIFARYDLEVPTTWQEFLNVCRILLENGEEPIVIAGGELGAPYNFLRPAMSTTVYPQYPDFDEKLREGAARFTDPVIIDTMEKFQYLVDQKYISPASHNRSLAAVQMAFANGTGAMYLKGSWELPNLLALNPELKLGYFPLPVADAEKDLYATCYTEYGIAVNKNTVCPEACDLYLEYLLREDVYQKFINAHCGLSTVKGIEGAGSSVFDGIIPYIAAGRYHSFPVFPGGTTSALYSALDAVYDGGDVYEAMWELQNKVDKLVANNN